jgi:hypothetical protein
MPLICRSAIYEPPSPEFPQVAIGFSADGKVILAQAVENETDLEELLRQFSKAQRDEFIHRKRGTMELKDNETREGDAQGP